MSALKARLLVIIVTNITRAYFHVCIIAPSCGLKRAKPTTGPLILFVLICAFSIALLCLLSHKSETNHSCASGIQDLAEQILLFLYRCYILTGAFVIYKLLSGCTIKSLVQMMEHHLSWGLWKTTQTKCQLVCMLQSDSKASWYFPTLQNTHMHLSLVRSQSLITSNTSYSSEPPSLVSYAVSCTGRKFFYTMHLLCCCILIQFALF